MTTHSNTHTKSTNNSQPFPTHLEDKPGRAPWENSLRALAVGQFFLLWYSMNIILGGIGPSALIRSFAISAIAGLVGYSVNHLSITHGTRLAALNFKGVRIFSILAILIVGFTISSATISGGAKNLVGELRLQDHHLQTETILANQNQIAIQATQTIPVLSSITTDLLQKIECERRVACLSETNLPGVGPITRLLQEKSMRAEDIARILENGETVRQGSLIRMSELSAEYQTVLDDDTIEFAERRASLQQIYARFVLEGSVLGNAIPLPLLFAYADELQRSVDIEGKPIATRNVDAVLNAHGKVLQRVLEGIEEGAIKYPPFPSRTSLADTFLYISYYWPFAGVIYAAEVGLPISIFVIISSLLYWKRYTISGPDPKIENHDIVTKFGEYLETLRVQTPNVNENTHSADNNLPTEKHQNNANKPNGRAV